ncbi:MAG: hypothetical protein JSV65_01455 [Armatimonadota bacterium]|nr:MAG: hypothetical protein JSV65_01455 [Armatimonadota bacterium]
MAVTAGRHADYISLLLRLKWQLMWHTYRRQVSAAVGAVLAVLLLLPTSLVVAGGCLAGFLLLKPPFNEHLLRGVLLAGYLMWVTAPFLGYELTEDYDVSKLLLYPLSPRQIFVGVICGSLLDFSVLFSLPTLLVIVIGFGRNIAVPMVILAVAFFLFHSVSLSQALNLATAGVLRSRRFRDIMIVLFPLLWIGVYAASQLLPRRAIHFNWSQILESRTWEIINLLPPGLAARTIAGAARGDYLAALGFLIGLAAVTAGTIYLAGWLVSLVYVGEVVSAPVRRRAARARAATPPVPQASAPGHAAARTRRTPFGIRLPPVVEAVMDKEIKYVFRDPYFKAALMQAVYMLVVMLVLALGTWRHDAPVSFEAGPIIAWVAAVFVLMAEAQLPFNIFGTEGVAASALFLFPSSRRHILIGKNLALFVALSVVNVGFIVILGALTGAMGVLIQLFLWAELALAILISVGNIISVWSPFRVTVRGWRMRPQSASRGLSLGLLYMAVTSVAFALALPVLAALVVPTYWISPSWFAATVPLALGYAVGVYALSLRLAEPMLSRREPEIAQSLAQED